MIFTSEQRDELHRMVNRLESREFINTVLDVHVLPWLEGTDLIETGRKITTSELRKLALDFLVAQTQSDAPSLTTEQILLTVNPMIYSATQELVEMTLEVCVLFSKLQGLTDEVVEEEVKNLDSELDKLFE